MPVAYWHTSVMRLARVILLGLATLALPASAAGATTLSGRVLTGGHGFGGADVRLSAATRSTTTLGTATTDASGRFKVAYTPPSRRAVVYATATAPGGMRLLSVAAGHAPGRLTLNE